MSKDKQMAGSPGRTNEKREKKNTLLCILKIKFNLPQKEPNRKKQSPTKKEDVILVNDSSVDLMKPIRTGNIEKIVQKHRQQASSNEREKNFFYNQFNITNQIFTMKKKKKLKDATASQEGDKFDIRTDNELTSSNKKKNFSERLILPKIKTGVPKKRAPLVIQNTQVFTLYKIEKKEHTVVMKDDLSNTIINIPITSTSLPITTANLPAKKFFKEDKSCDSESELLINNQKSLINDIPIIKPIPPSIFSLEQGGYEQFKKFFPKQYSCINTVDNSSSPIMLNTYTVTYL